MRSVIRTILAIGLALFNSGAIRANSYLPPSEDTTRDLEFTTIDNTTRSATIEYHSEDISVSGTVVSKSQGNTLEFYGIYQTRQELETGIRLGFQVYSNDGKLLLLDGKRTDFYDSTNRKEANFHYTYPLEGLKIPSGLREFVIKFNYVKEGEYWADVKYPDTELPAFRFKDLKRGERFHTLFSYFPTLIPENSNAYSIHLYRPTKTKSDPFNHSASIEARYIDSKKPDDNKRYQIKNKDGSSIQFLIARFKLEKQGAIFRRLGFVWDGVQWYKQPEGTFRRSYVLSITSYLIACTISVLIVLGIFYWSTKRKNKKTRYTCFLATTLAFLFLVLEFPSPLLPILIVTVMAPLLGKKLMSLRHGLYWSLLAFTLATDAFWTHVIETGATQAHANLLSLFLTGIVLFPFALVERRSTTLILGNIMLLVISSYYMTMSFYYMFFEDYPTLNVLTYANQGSDLFDSIFSFLDGRFFILAIIISSFGFAINHRPKQTHQTLASK